MKNFSGVIAGLIVALGVPILVQVGFTDGCSSEIVNILSPVPGLLIAYLARLKQGDITRIGFRKA